MFGCEKIRILKRFAEKRHGVLDWYDDVTSSTFRDLAPRVDVLVAGFDCQPFSAAGLHLGVLDPGGRGVLVFHILHYVKVNLPPVVILENVKGLVRDHPDLLHEVLKVLLSFEKGSTASIYYSSTDY